MENASKALLIAAAVLIAIVLIALGVRLLSSMGDTTKEATDVAEKVGETTEKASKDLINNLPPFNFKIKINVSGYEAEYSLSAKHGTTWREFIEAYKTKPDFYYYPKSVIVSNKDKIVLRKQEDKDLLTIVIIKDPTNISRYLYYEVYEKEKQIQLDDEIKPGTYVTVNY